MGVCLRVCDRERRYTYVRVRGKGEKGEGGGK